MVYNKLISNFVFQNKMKMISMTFTNNNWRVKLAELESVRL